MLEDARLDNSAYAKALAGALNTLVCSDFDDVAYILRGLLTNGRLASTDMEAPRLVQNIMSKDCPVSASLTDTDKARLLQIKQRAIETPQ